MKIVWRCFIGENKIRFTSNRASSSDTILVTVCAASVASEDCCRAARAVGGAGEAGEEDGADLH